MAWGVLCGRDFGMDTGAHGPWVPNGRGNTFAKGHNLVSMILIRGYSVQCNLNIGELANVKQSSPKEPHVSLHVPRYCRY